MRRTFYAATSVFAAVMAFFIFGSGFVLLRFLPGGRWRVIIMSAFGLAFAAVFVWLLLTRMTRVFADGQRNWPHLIMMGANLLLVIAAFAAAYQVLGIRDTTGDQPQVTYNYWTALYYSTVTMTTLGYGDMQPTAATRFLAALQAVVGYLVLGLLASTLGTLLQQYGKAARDGESPPTT